MLVKFVIQNHLKAGSGEDFNHMGVIVHDCVLESIITALGRCYNHLKTSDKTRPADTDYMVGAGQETHR